MPEPLSSSAIRQFRNDGFTPAVRVMSEKEAVDYRNRLQAVETVIGELKGGYRLKCHLLYKWIADLIRSPAIVQNVQALLGPNLMCWGTDLWLKEANSDQFVSWHQDSQYWGIDGDQLLTAWIALSPATVESGCMRMIPGSHLEDALAHEDTYHNDNMLTRGQTICEGIDESKAVNIEVGTGEAVFFTYRIAHASHPNRSDDRRLGIAIRYVSTVSKQLKSDWDSATMICGEDLHGNFVHEPEPSRDFDPVAVEFHRKSNENYRKILYSDTDWTSHRT
ncbi:MAG: phytanoyl-CoA dioxygenase family protein [Acidiferrobacterales bacterium]|nr:phytanoyl-CoA dioxygenase family protein [Acidiferrobacterales bacterium]